MERTRQLGMLAIAVLALVGISSCGPPETFDREQMLRDTLDEVIAPTHDELSEAAGALESSVAEFCEGDRTGDQLEAAREDWRALQAPLKQIQAWSFNMSPYRGSSFDVLFYKIDREPASGENIEAIIEGDAEIDESFLAEEDYRRNIQGYPAVEYLLFGEPDGDETEVLYESGAEHADRRCDYLVAATTHAGGVVDSYLEAWDSEGGNFAKTFASPDSEETGWTSVQDSIDAMVSQMVFVTKQRVSKDLLGGPLNQLVLDDTVPNLVSSPYANYSLAQIRETFRGVEKLYRGPDGKSLAAYTKFRKKAVHRDVSDGFESVHSAVDEIPEPLQRAVAEDQETVEAAQQVVDDLTSVIETNLETSLGASTTRVVVDND